ncbi:hypothetical protein AMECASPLE_014949 [Ameca splendens]|uniref:Uncharacterized protein n=1 Tax=Ameca splendens TaxID=208324 RepID=A0ABV0Y1R2_9TELE
MLPNCKIISQLEICVSMNVSIILHEPFLVGKHLCLVILVSDALLEFMMLCVIYNKQEYWEIHSSESDRERPKDLISLCTFWKTIHPGFCKHLSFFLNQTQNSKTFIKNIDVDLHILPSHFIPQISKPHTLCCQSASFHGRNIGGFVSAVSDSNM